MLLQLQFLHFSFLKKKKINSTLLKNKLEFIYCILLKNTVVFLTILEMKYSTCKKNNTSWIYNLQLSIPDKTLFNLVMLWWLNIVNSLKMVENIKFFNAGLRQTKFTVLRSPFVHKESREQLCFKYYKGKLIFNFFINNYLINEFVIIFFLEKLRSLSSFEIKQLKKTHLL